MFTQEQIQEVIDMQKEAFLSRNISIPREALPNVPAYENFATLITGLRRCGKSTLLLQVLKEKYDDALFLNFEDIRLSGFDREDLIPLYNEIVRRGIKVLFFDELQLVHGWEIFVHQLLREGYMVFVTGSNAALMSKEMGTHLTGRHLSMELFPFSYQEFLTFKGLDANVESLDKYLKMGGIPEYVKTGLGDLVANLVDDILIRDIVVRHGIRDVDSLKQLAIYLITNAGSLVSATKLVGMFGIKSAATILEYFSFYRNAYLVEFLPQFSYSLKAQIRNPKKVYAIDVGMTKELSVSHSEDLGHRLENLVYLHLRRKYKELYFFKEKGECDFVAYNKGQAKAAVQVCWHVERINMEREYKGLIEAMNFFKLKEGIIVTYNQRDSFVRDGLSVNLVPAFDYLLGKV